MVKDFILITIKDEDGLLYDMCVKKDENFEEKYSGVVDICNSFENFQEVEDYIVDNFERVYIEKREIEVY